MKLAFTVILFFFGIGFYTVFVAPETPVVKHRTAFSTQSGVRKPTSAYQAPAESIEDDGAEEDLDALQLDKNLCSSPECLYTGKTVAPLTESVHSSLNPIAMAFAGYSNSDAVEELVRMARQQIAENPTRYIVRKSNGRVQTYCYGAVKDALRGAGMLADNYYCSGFARNGVVDLENPRAGFKNLLDFPKKTDPNYETKVAINSMLVNHPEMAPKGTVLVYRTIPGAKRSDGKAVDLAGHTEIKIGDVGEDLYISVSEKTVPTYGYSLVSQRTLIGIMYLPRLLSLDSIYYQGQTPF